MIESERARNDMQQRQKGHYDQMEAQMASDPQHLQRHELSVRAGAEVENWKRRVEEAERAVREADARVVEANTRVLTAEASHKEEVIKRQNSELSLSELQMVITEMQQRGNEEAQLRIQEWEAMSNEKLMLEKDLAAQSEMQLKLSETAGRADDREVELETMREENGALLEGLAAQGALVEYLKRGFMRALLEAGDLVAIEKMKEDLQRFEASTAMQAKQPSTRNHNTPPAYAGGGAGRQIASPAAKDKFRLTAAALRKP